MKTLDKNKLPFRARPASAVRNFIRKQDFRRNSHSFMHEEDGSLIIFSLYLLVIMLIVAGMGVDLMRAETQRSRLQSTLDRAILAGASLEQTLNSEDVVRDYFDKAGLLSYLKSVDVVETVTSKTVTATAQMEVNSFFMNLVGVDKLQSPAAGQAEESLSDIEISLVLDISGSMGSYSSSGGDTKINLLKHAAKDFVYLMQCDPDAAPPFDNDCVVDPDTISISVVPYNHQVVAGEQLLQMFNTTEEHQNSSCLNLVASDYNSVPLELDPMVIDPIGGTPDPTPNLRRESELDFWSGYWGYTARRAVDSRRECPPNTAATQKRAVIPYANDYQDLMNKIDDLTAGGNTSIDLASKWGAALLAPDFRPGLTTLINQNAVTNGFSGRPFDYNRPRTRKVMVVMTDGINTSRLWIRDNFRSGLSPIYVVKSNHDAVPNDIDNWNPSSNHVTVYNQDRDDAGLKPYYRVDHGDWRWSPDGGNKARRLTWPEVWNQYHPIFIGNAMNWANQTMGVVNWYSLADYDYTSIKDSRLLSLCSAAKNQGIIIYTIGFETTSASNAILQQCASSDAHHFDVVGTDLRAAFDSIARDINQLRLTQ